MQDEIEQLRQAIVAIEKKQQDFTFELSRLHSDYNIERGFNRIFRVIVVVVMLTLIGMVAWVGFSFQSMFFDIKETTRTTLIYELARYDQLRKPIECSPPPPPTRSSNNWHE